MTPEQVRGEIEIYDEADEISDAIWETIWAPVIGPAAPTLTTGPESLDELSDLEPE